MPSLGDSAFIFVLALLLFGPKKLPELARQLGKLMGEFRRASNEFRMQMEDELRISEQADRQKEIAAIAAATPVTPAIDPGPNSIAASAPVNALEAPGADPQVSASPGAGDTVDTLDPHRHVASFAEDAVPAADPDTDPAPATPEPQPIANSGSLQMRAPRTGMPVAQTTGLAAGQAAARAAQPESDATLSPLFDAIPQVPSGDFNATSGDVPTANEAPHHA